MFDLFLAYLNQINQTLNDGRPTAFQQEMLAELILTAKDHGISHAEEDVSILVSGLIQDLDDYIKLYGGSVFCPWLGIDLMADEPLERSPEKVAQLKALQNAVHRFYKTAPYMEWKEKNRPAPVEYDDDCIF